MQFIVWIETVIADKSVAVHRVATVERTGVNDPTEQGLTLQDGKAIINGIEQDIVQTQVDLRRSSIAVLTGERRGLAREADLSWPVIGFRP